MAAILKICKLGQKRPFKGNHIVIVELGDPENLGVVTKIKIIEASKAELSHGIVKMAAILEICKLLKTLKSDFGKLFFWTSPKVLEQIKKVKQTVAICSK